jgi:ankyrin repeat protein
MKILIFIQAIIDISINLQMLKPVFIRSIINYASNDLDNIKKFYDVNSIWKETIKYYSYNMWNRLKNENKDIWLHAICKGNKDLIISLYCNGIDINSAVNPWGETALMIACNKGNEELVELLCQMDGININKKDDSKLTALMHACYNDFPKCVKLLYQMDNIDVNAKDCIGCTALMTACEEGAGECVDYLLKINNVDINYKNESGKTALMLACEEHIRLFVVYIKSKEKCVKLLCQMDEIDINAKDNNGRTALMSADKNEYTKCAEILKKYGAT